MPAIDRSLSADQRMWLHEQIIARGVLAINGAGIATNSDKGDAPSRAIAANLAHRLIGEVRERQADQTSGATFEVLIAEFLRRAFPDIVGRLDPLVVGKRLKDISDLPLDLCVWAMREVPGLVRKPSGGFRVRCDPKQKAAGLV